MFKRLKNLWQLSKRDKSTLTEEHIALLKREMELEEELRGDGKAQFINEGTKEDFEEQQKKDKGLFNLFRVK